MAGSAGSCIGAVGVGRFQSDAKDKAEATGCSRRPMACSRPVWAGAWAPGDAGVPVERSLLAPTGSAPLAVPAKILAEPPDTLKRS